MKARASSLAVIALVACSSTTAPPEGSDAGGSDAPFDAAPATLQGNVSFLEIANTGQRVYTLDLVTPNAMPVAMSPLLGTIAAPAYDQYPTRRIDGSQLAWVHDPYQTTSEIWLADGTGAPHKIYTCDDGCYDLGFDATGRLFFATTSGLVDVKTLDPSTGVASDFPPSPTGCHTRIALSFDRTQIAIVAAPPSFDSAPCSTKMRLETYLLATTDTMLPPPIVSQAPNVDWSVPPAPLLGPGGRIFELAGALVSSKPDGSDRRTEIALPTYAVDGATRGSSGGALAFTPDGRFLLANVVYAQAAQNDVTLMYALRIGDSSWTRIDAVPDLQNAVPSLAWGP